MRINATVEVSNRLLPTLNMGQRRPEKSYLSIGYLPGQREKVFVLHQTLKNAAGVKYKVNDNVLTLFVKYLKEGKATLRFKEPPVDLIIKGEPQHVSNFFSVLNQFLQKKVPLKVLKLSNLAGAPTKVDSKPSTKLIIKEKKEYPPFPRTLELLQINQVMMKKFDHRILRLQHLKVLNLEDNCLEDIPREIDLLPKLQELHLAKNRIGEKSNFTWMFGTTVRSSLTLLDLRENSLSWLPQELCRLKNLNTLLLDKNLLLRLPNGLGLLSKLRKLSVSWNMLDFIPGSCQFLKLNYIDVSHNRWLVQNWPRNVKSVVNLLDIAAIAVLKHSIEFSEELIPRTLVCYLENAGYCLCKVPVFPGLPNKFSPLTRYLKGGEHVFRMGENTVIGFTSCSKHINSS